MKIIRFVISKRQDVGFFKKKSYSEAGEDRMVYHYIPGMDSLAGISGGVIMLVDRNGRMSWVSRRGFEGIYDSIPEVPPCNGNEPHELFVGLLKHLSVFPESTVILDTARVFTRSQYIGVTAHAMAGNIRLKYIEDPCLGTAKYASLLRQGINAGDLRVVMAADYDAVCETPFGKVVENKLEEEKLGILSIGGTCHHTASRNMIVECLCRIHIDCAGYMTTDACMGFIKDAMGIDASVSYGTFRKYVAEAAELCRERGRVKGKKILLPILRY